MKVAEQASLESLNTFRVPARAALLVTLESEEDLLSLPPPRPDRDLLLGGGSNILLVDDVPGTVLLNRIRGIDVLERDADAILIEVGAGENWHALVQHAIAHGWHGLENLSLIPGLAGAAPVQNIGAYGVELSSVLRSVTAWDMQRATWAVLDAADCRLGYRDSLFRSHEPDRYLITSIRLRLPLPFTPRIEYAGIAEALARDGVTGSPSAAQVSQAVIRLRQQKLPDPQQAGNAGSFFKNPEVGADTAGVLADGFPALPRWPLADGAVKLSAAWMIEHCSLKGLARGGAAVSGRHALVLVNEGHATGAEVWQLATEVMNRVEDRFGIRLEPEPRIYRAPGARAERKP